VQDHCGPILNEKNKQLVPKIKINLYKSLSNVINIFSSNISIYMFNCLLKLELVESPTVFFFC
jgi:hypothetical protein